MQSKAFLSLVTVFAAVMLAFPSYANDNTLVQYDKSRTDVKQIEKAVSATGYRITETKKK